MLESKHVTWFIVLALGSLSGCGGDADTDAGGGLDSGPPMADTAPPDTASPVDAAPADTEPPVVDSGSADVGPPSDGGDAGACSGEIVECHPAPSDEFRCGGDSCPVACGDLAECSACAAHAMPPGVQSYFDTLALPVVEFEGTLLHCGQAACSLVADFNGDGTDDWAGMFRNTEPRGGGWNMDLLIIYSDGSEYRHLQYPYFGRIVDGISLTYIALENPGPITGYAVSLTLDYPSIRTYRLDLVGDSPAPGCYEQSTVFHWDGATFARQGLSFVP